MEGSTSSPPTPRAGIERLLDVVQELSAAKRLEDVQAIVRVAARALVGADGATFVLRDHDYCYYVDEDAIGPLWKGRRFPSSVCIAGWAMEHQQAVVIDDVFADPRIPQSVYRETFVKSMTMTPIRPASALGAIGTYWATPHRASQSDLRLLAALANTTAVALENVRLYGELSARLDQLQRVNDELERFTWVTFHDLQEPLRMIATHSQLVNRDEHSGLSERQNRSLRHVHEGVRRAQALTRGFAEYVEVLSKRTAPREVDLRPVVCSALEQAAAQQGVPIPTIELGDPPRVVVDPLGLVRVLGHLFANAIKFRHPERPLELAVSVTDGGARWHFTVRDNGIGIDATYHRRIFAFFERLHPQDEFVGAGLGLAVCRKIIEGWGGAIGVRSEPGAGSEFHFTVPKLTAEAPHAG